MSQKRELMKFFKLLLFILLFLNTHLYAKEGSLEKVTLQLQWKHQFEFAGFYAAKEKGFYKNVGLDVTFLEYNGKSTVDKVVKGEVDYGLDYSSIMAEYVKGKPIVFIANFFKQSPLVIIAQEEIKTPSDLKYKIVMGVSDTIDNITLINMLNKFDVDIKDILSAPASFNLDAFINKKIDAMSVFTTNELYVLATQGIKYTLFNPTVYGAEYYDLNLFTSKHKVQQNPEQVKKFKEASVKGWEYALAHKEEIADLIMRKYNTQHRSRKALLYESRQIEQLMLANVYPIGSIDHNRVRLILEDFKQAGFIDSNHFNIEGFLFENNKRSTKTVTQNTSLYLSDTEKNFLQKKKEIKMCVHPDWMPYENIQYGKYIGISANYIQQISSAINIPIKLIPTKTWSESLALFKDDQCDIIPFVATTPYRQKFMEFTEAYVTSPFVVVTKNDKSFISDMSELQNKKIGLLRNYGGTEILESKYLNVHFIKFNTLIEGLELVAEGKLYGFIDSLTTISYQIQKHFPAQLKIAGQLDEKLNMGIATHKNEHLLLSILNKAVNTMDIDTKTNILNQWISVKFDNKDHDVKAFWKIFSPILLLGILLLISHYALGRYNRKLKTQVNLNIEELREKDEILIQKQRMADMGEMLSMIAHQWRQPLGAINSAILGINIKIESGQFNLDDPTDQKKFIEYLGKKHKNITDYVQHLSNTTDDFRNFFNPNKHKDTNHLTLPMKNALKIVEKSMNQNGIEIIKNFQADPVFMMYTNEIMQVVLNLLKNSEYNFSDKHISDPKITLSTFFRNKKMVISICDNGGGIPKEIAKRIFEPYFSTKNEKNGTGLGLYMSKIIIEDHHNGILEMKNRDGGVCFEMIFKMPKEST